MKIFQIVFFGLLLLSSCASKEEQIESQKLKVEQIKNNYDLKRGTKLYYSTDKINSSFTYFTDNNDIVIINEEMFISNLGHSSNLHFYNNNKIIYTEMIQMLYEPQESGFDKKTTDITIYYDDKGNVLDYKKLTNKRPDEMSEDELKELLDHSRKIFDLATKDFKQKN